LLGLVGAGHEHHRCGHDMQDRSHRARFSKTEAAHNTARHRLATMYACNGPRYSATCYARFCSMRRCCCCALSTTYAVMFTISSTVASFCIAATGLLTPRRIGPTGVALPNIFIIWYAALPEASDGNTIVFAARVSRENG